MKRSIVATFLFFLISGVDAFAQTGSTQNSLLPEIDPQDIEIRSEFRARFPGIRRQPILGFNPSSDFLIAASINVTLFKSQT